VKYGWTNPAPITANRVPSPSGSTKSKEKGLISNFRDYKDEHGETHFDVVNPGPDL